MREGSWPWRQRHGGIGLGPRLREKGAGLDVSSQVRAGKFSNSSRNFVSETKMNHARKHKCRMTHSGEGKDVNDQGPWSKPRLARTCTPCGRRIEP